MPAEVSPETRENGLEAVIESTIFRNEENGYSVVEIRTGREKAVTRFHHP